ncbi:hypothetical protein HMPREF9013_0229 [Bulleidia extructa W1219]|uniref:Uncharacterized protein n=2 Tax=Bulleidia TaxID=118747 RepID=D2MNK4_9FIRM|nr:hypothetical protein HMPREF9013_0229 [Bulleidia extructa W1219]
MKVEGGCLVDKVKLLNGKKLNPWFSNCDLIEFNGKQGGILYSLWKKDDFSSTNISLDIGIVTHPLPHRPDKMKSHEVDKMGEIFYKGFSIKSMLRKIISNSEEEDD